VLIVLLRIPEKPEKEQIVTVFCNNLMLKAVFSHNALAISRTLTASDSYASIAEICF